MVDMVGLFVTFWTAPGRADELLQALETVIATAREEEGTLVYAVHRLAGDRDGVAVYELYRDAEAQRVHAASIAVARLKERLPELLAGPPEFRRLAPASGAKGLHL